MIRTIASALIAAAVCVASADAGTNALPRETEFGWRAPGYVPDELLVKFKGGVSAARAASLIRAKGALAKRALASDGLIQVKLPKGASVPDEIAAWESIADVEYAAPNLYARGFFVPNDPLIGEFDLGWNLRSVGAYDAWDVVTGDPGVVLAIIDSGVAFEDHPVPGYERPFITPGVTMYRRSPELPGPFLPGYDFVNYDDHPNDDNGHGTMVATIAAGAANNHLGSSGIAFGITILPIKVLDDWAEGTTATIVPGIRYAADHGANIANLSLGFPSVTQLRQRGVPSNVIAHTFKPLKDAIVYAQRRGVIVIAAAGNFGYPEVSFPAGYGGVISVAASGVDGSLASYSSFGNGLSFVAPGGDFTDQNGDHVQDLIPVLSIKRRFSEGSPAKPDSFGVFYFIGTSAAAPHVSGAVALLMSLGVKDQGSIEQILRATAVHPFGNPNAHDVRYGFGLIQIDKAVRLAAANGSRSLARGRRAGWSARLETRNPARDGATLRLRTTRPGTVRVRLLDVRGALVRTVEEGTYPAGERLVRWDGRNERGEPVPSGVYFFRVESQDGVLSQRVAVLH